jgi:transposase InsO family protein
MCVLHPPGPVDPFRDCRQTIDAVEPASRADSAEVSPAVLVESTREARPQGAQPGRHCCRRRHETAEPELGGCPRIAQQITLAFGVSIDRDVVRRILAARYEPTPDSAGPSWLTVLGHAKDSLWSVDLFRCESAVLHTYWVLVVMDHWTRRIVGFGVHRGAVDGVALCRMFNHASCGQSLPTYLSADHDLLYRFHQWQANLRILNIREIKTVPYVPRSHPVVERLIGTVRRECLDRMLFWTAADLEGKLVEFQQYYNEHRTHAGRAGRPPAPSLDAAGARASVRAYRWQPHCHGLYHTPRAA